MKLSAPIHHLKRRAKLLARNEKIALHEALDRTARAEGFEGWSLLSSRSTRTSVNSTSGTLLSSLAGGDLLLLAARPGHGKTLMALQLLLDAARAERKAVFFTLEYTERETRDRIRSLGEDAASMGDKIEIVASDDISAEFIARHLRGSRRGTVAVVDYLQILDQKREKPALSDQLLALRDFARETGAIFGFISQIDRSFDPQIRPVPDIEDIRLPNPIDPAIFSKACFMHDGEVLLRDAV